ncbi:MAG: hypothetical protein ABL912_14365 [Novosphingobium sp.]
MRSGIVLAGLVLLAGCDGGSPQQDKVENLVITDGPATAPARDDSVATAMPTPPAIKPQEKRLQALGTEPFWSFDIQGDRLSYTSPEQLTPVVIEAHLTAMGKHGNGGLLYEGLMDGKPVSLMIREGECSDGMSDTVYPYKASFTWGDQTQQGCARVK